MKNSHGLHHALKQAGITETSSQADIDRATKEYWREYHRAYQKKRGKRGGKRFTLRFNDTEYEKLTSQASEAGVAKNLGGYIKRMVLGNQFYPTAPYDREALDELLSHTRSIKNDLNKVVQRLTKAIQLRPEAHNDTPGYQELHQGYCELIESIKALECLVSPPSLLSTLITLKQEQPERCKQLLEKLNADTYNACH